MDQSILRTEMPKKKGDKTHPNSLANLKIGGNSEHNRRPTDYEQPKQRHGVLVTPRGWEGLAFLAQQVGVSVSELLERIGRGKVLIEREQAEALQLHLDTLDSQRRLAAEQETATSYQQARQRLELN